MSTSLLALGSGSLIGLVLGLIGGGGSILAVPLLVYAVGEPSPHVAIGTAAFAVAVNAAASLGLHARRAPVRWPCALVFSAAGIGGALAGAALGKMIDGQKLLALFGLLMIVVGVMMLRPRRAGTAPSPWLSAATARHLLPRLVALGAGVGLLSGFFGIGGGFLIVPGLILAADMELPEAASASLVAVTAFGIASASSYAWSGLVDWPVAGLLIAGGAVGAVLGAKANTRLAGRKGVLARVFAWFVMAAGVYVGARGVLTVLEA
ncbi:MAG: sulfite exporter TauE/SafE family protein [Reyranella sp.]|uniref:sulfite exporter TauE/SafE family protein n=1 Tax=Reyranella sp. TaxID=1929291 RepID=UPI003D100B93